ncbi:stage III sporulation protein AF [Bacillus methanolicus]|uniref:Stage III sporulation protein AF n=1 Tax=Bacillus methanolicus (strain MGA3 / ATCC 53907) TaxID=796606 RepID=I3EAC4_BACMM|nr:stage III sporulation protein AF [Bacillus methanolicus]AIE60685.1 stage III sporulation protein AF [Bacillus methanolicus MGA3]EIJ83445.1 stage III sporulation protein AF [Bacillus methanolicus MGA3]
MDFLKEWITNIILFILLATVIDMLLPNSNLQKYTKIVTGLLLIAIILTPVLKLFSKDFETVLASVALFENPGEKNMENQIEMKKKEIQASQQAYILKQMAVKLEKDAEEELMEQYGLEITKIDFLVNKNDKRAFPENLAKLKVQLRQPKEQSDAIEAVKKVEINTNKPLPSKKTAEMKKITSFLSQKWNMDDKDIEVLIEGGIPEENEQ